MLCYGGEAWTIRKRDESRITACEMKFMRRTAGYTKGDLKRNEDVLKELKVEHVNRMSRTRIPKAIMYCQPRGKRSLGRPVKRWHENPLLRS
jgi:hypothetical protein